MSKIDAITDDLNHYQTRYYPVITHLRDMLYEHMESDENTMHQHKSTGPP